MEWEGYIKLYLPSDHVNIVRIVTRPSVIDQAVVGQRDGPFDGLAIEGT